MAQKIVIQESAADQWPKAYGMDTKKPGGVEFFIGLSLEGTIFMAKESNPAPIEWQSKPDWWNFEYGIRLGFNSFKSAIEWWLDPQPIEPPKPLTFGQLAIGEWFCWAADRKMGLKFSITQAIEIPSNQRWTVGDDIPVTRCTVTKEE